MSNGRSLKRFVAVEQGKMTQEKTRTRAASSGWGFDSAMRLFAKQMCIFGFTPHHATYPRVTDVSGVELQGVVFRSNERPLDPILDG